MRRHRREVGACRVFTNTEHGELVEAGGVRGHTQVVVDAVKVLLRAGVARRLAEGGRARDHPAGLAQLHHLYLPEVPGRSAWDALVTHRQRATSYTRLLGSCTGR
eukprot:1192188-Prorocentrum_minimum.AAC.9